MAGGGEDDETPVQAANREVQEEIGIAGQCIQLDSVTSIPKIWFPGLESRGDDILVILEYSFALDAGESEITLSSEHGDIKWLSYEQAFNLLKWDSNRTALWELNERMLRKR